MNQARITESWGHVSSRSRVRALSFSTPVFTNVLRVRRFASTADGTIGFRLSPEVTLKAGYQGSRTYMRDGWDHAAAVSFVYARRW
jgi:hypothetical protein